MARLNELPVSADSLETLRKKFLKQNRELAKINNVRALKIRELENECACMLSENLELRGRILELEKEVEDNDARRIADHALAIKNKLEAQLAEWGTLLAGLGLEPPMKKQSPRIRKSTAPRPSFNSARRTPPRPELEDVARKIEALGHISESKSCPRRSLNPEQILALRSEADSADSPELGPPPISQFIDDDPVKVDSPTQSRSTPAPKSSPKSALEPPETLSSPSNNKSINRSPSPEKQKATEAPPQAPNPRKPIVLDQTTTPVPPPPPQPAKTGSKRKFSTRDEMANNRPQIVTDENAPPKSATEKQSIRDRAGGRTLKELASMRKETRERPGTVLAPRKPLAAKSTNDDMSSPKKNTQPAILDEVAAAKADLLRSKASQERAKAKAKSAPVVTAETVVIQEPIAPLVKEVTCELGPPLTAEAGLLSPTSPDPTSSSRTGTRGATPPPTDIVPNREPARPSRRNRTAVSYAEPNLRDKMRRPTKELYDAVSGEGKYARRSSHIETVAPESVKIKRETSDEDSWKTLPAAPGSGKYAPDSIPASPLAGKGTAEHLPNTVVTDRRKRSSIATKDADVAAEETHVNSDVSQLDSVDGDSVSAKGIDVYEFNPSSPQPEKQAPAETKRRTNGRKTSRRVSAAVQNDEGLATKERGASRRRSMML